MTTEFTTALVLEAGSGDRDAGSLRLPDRSLGEEGGGHGS